MIDYVNMNKDFIPKETKTFAKINGDELIERIKQRVLYLSQSKDFYDEIEEPDPNDKWASPIHDYYASILCGGCCRIVENDLSWIRMFGENFTANEVHGNSDAPEDKHLVGLHTLENGLTLVGCMDGGDWEWPVYFFLYYDGTNIRAYIPSYGNAINLDSKTAFGSEEESEDMSLEDLKKLYNLSDDDDGDYFTELYLRKQGITSVDNISINWDAIREEILTVFK